MSYDTRHLLAPVGSTGSQTHASVDTGGPEGHFSAAFEFICEAVGGTPTVTWKIQCSTDDKDTSDANSAWYDLGYVTDASDTIATGTRTITAGRQINFLSNPVARKYRKYRLVTSANTNVTYRCEMRLEANH